MRLDAYLEKTQIPVGEFAHAIGVHRTSVYRFMTGLSFPKRVTLMRIASVTGGRVTANDFIALSQEGRASAGLAATG